MTEVEAEYGERLRRALHAAADGVVPSGDGLERIRHRIVHRPAWDSFGVGLLRDWLGSAAAGFGVGLPDLRLVIAALKAVLLPAAASRQIGAASSRLDRGRGEVRRAPATASRRGGLLGPVFTTAGAVVVAAAAILAIPGLRQNVTVRISSLMQRSGGGQPARDNPRPAKPRPSHPAFASGPGTHRPSPTDPFVSPSPRHSAAKPSHRPRHPTATPTACAPAPGQASPPASLAPAPGRTRATAPRPRHSRATCGTPTGTPTGTLTWSPALAPAPASSSTPTPTPTPTPSLAPSGTQTAQGSAQARPRYRRHWPRHWWEKDCKYIRQHHEHFNGDCTRAAGCAGCVERRAHDALPLK